VVGDIVLLYQKEVRVGNGMRGEGVVERGRERGKKEMGREGRER
jgi:hypothetical protein